MLALIILALNLSVYVLNELYNEYYLVVSNNVEENVIIPFFTYKWMYNNKVKKKHYLHQVMIFYPYF